MSIESKYYVTHKMGVLVTNLAFRVAFHTQEERQRYFITTDDLMVCLFNILFKSSEKKTFAI